MQFVAETCAIAPRVDQSLPATPFDPQGDGSLRSEAGRAGFDLYRLVRESANPNSRLRFPVPACRADLLHGGATGSHAGPTRPDHRIEFIPCEDTNHRRLPFRVTSTVRARSWIP